MNGRVPLAVQTEAACRAARLYQALGQPRRLFSSLLLLCHHRGAQNDNAGAHAALDQARGLIRPDWPAEFRIRLLRRDGRVARAAGRFIEALALHRESVRFSASTGDWRLEVIEWTNLLDLLWQMGPIEEAAHEARKLVEALRARPAAHTDMDTAFTNSMGILSEVGSIEEASTAARDALLTLRRTRRCFIEEWVYLFWRRGQLDTASLLLGACDARNARAEEVPQPNEQRLIAEARAGLEAAVHSDMFATSLAAGAGLGDGDLLALISKALESDGEQR
jgi:tetratricopeptide (TPR) repeat protein